MNQDNSTSNLQQLNSKTTNITLSQKQIEDLRKVIGFYLATQFLGGDSYYANLQESDIYLLLYLYTKDSNDIKEVLCKELLLTKKKLFKQQKKALIGDLAAGLAHEIKNLLNPLSFLELLKDEVSVNNREYLRYAYEVRSHILELVENLRLIAKEGACLCQSRVEENCLCKSSHKLNTVIEESVNLSRLDFDVRDKNICLDLNYQGHVSISKNKIIQVLLNLIRNAAHALDNVLTGKIIIKTHAKDGYVKVAVIDNGRGVEKNILDKIWQPFFTTKENNSTGLGLHICRQIIESHGGEMYYSQENRESQFCFSLCI